MIAEWIATCGGIGYVTRMPGTVASGVACVSAWILRTLVLSSQGLLFITAPLLFLGLWASNVLQSQRQEHDPAYIVIDEWVAVWGLCAGVPLVVSYFVFAFLLFRVLDILKPWPVRWAERRFHGGLGIMLDDIVAALYSVALLAVAVRVVAGIIGPG